MQKDGQEIPLSPITPVIYQTLNEELASQKPYQDLETQPSSRDGSISSSTKKRYYGNNYVFLWKNREPLCNLGPHWYLFIATWIGLEAAGIYFYFQLASEASAPIKYGAIALIIWEGFIYMLTGLKNPGIVSAENPNDPNLMKLADNHNFCMKCKVLRDETTYHCWDCNVCIKGYDHHCPWTGKCIGKGNLYPFYAFLVSTAFYLVFFMMITFSHLR